MHSQKPGVPKPVAAKVKPPIPPMTAADIRSVKENAWKKAQERIEAADKVALEKVDRSLDVIRTYFAE